MYTPTDEFDTEIYFLYALIFIKSGYQHIYIKKH